MGTHLMCFSLLCPLSDLDHGLNNSYQEEQKDVNLAENKPIFYFLYNKKSEIISVLCVICVWQTAVITCVLWWRNKTRWTCQVGICLFVLVCERACAIVAVYLCACAPQTRGHTVCCCKANEFGQKKIAVVKKFTGLFFLENYSNRPLKWRGTWGRLIRLSSWETSPTTPGMLSVELTWC